MKEKKVKISIIIVTNNQKDLLTQCLLHLSSNSLTFKSKEVIIVDNASPYPDYIKGLCAQHNFRYIRSDENLSFSYANELAIEQAHGKYYLLLNDDTVPSQEFWLEKFMDFTKQHPKAGVVGCKLLYPNGTLQHAGIVFNQYRQPFHRLNMTDSLDDRLKDSKQFQAVTFACVLIKRKCYEEVQGFSHIEKTPAYHYEDVDFCFKARKSGYEVWYNSDISIIHYSNSSFKAVLKSQEETFKFLPQLKQKWWVDIDHDDWESFDLPVTSKHVVVGIPLSDGSQWIFQRLMNMVDGLYYWKKRMTIILGLDNCSPNFIQEVRAWAIANANKYADILIPEKAGYSTDKGQSIVTNRNNIRAKALEIGADYVFYIDSDVAMGRDTLQKLVTLAVKENVDITAGTYFYKTENKPKPMLFESLLPSERFKQLGMKDKINKSSSAKEKAMGLGNFKLAKHLMDGGVHEAGAVNMGCTLISRKALLEIPFTIEDCYGTEDLAWFSNAQAKGFKLLVDTSLQLFHLDQNGFIYCWWNQPIVDKGYCYKLKPVKEKVPHGVYN